LKTNLREIRQKEFADIAFREKDGLLHLTSRFGKIKTSFNFIKSTDKVLVIYPKNPIKQSWMDDGKKWNFNLKNFKFISTASLHKVMDETFDWVIWDEPQEVLSDKVLTCISRLCKNNHIIGLSGSLSVKTLEKIKLWTGLKVIAEYPQSLAIAEGVVTDYEITVQGLYLDKELMGKYKWITDKLDEMKQTMQYHNMISFALMTKR